MSSSPLFGVAKFSITVIKVAASARASSKRHPSTPTRKIKRGLTFLGLGNVHVHLIAVKIGIVRRADALVEAEGSTRQHLHFVAHDGDTMQRRLAIEEHDVAIVQVTLNDIAVLHETLLDMRISYFRRQHKISVREAPQRISSEVQPSRKGACSLHQLSQYNELPGGHPRRARPTSSSATIENIKPSKAVGIM